MSKVVTHEEFKKHQSKSDFYVLIHDKVYDVSKFLDEHPGGDEVIMAEAGKDATEAFEDVGHSDEARALLAGMLVGTFDGGDTFVKKKKTIAPGSVKPSSSDSGSSITYLLPLAALGAYFAYRFYFQG
ncbi:cytochrome b5 [Exidia glandulosa HHB12029]|uniref:Cytochrome b5 n=1 Tax=Exidia glandulosa HHB12029 TaxID=1314781 RepID=A0A165R015_EXIGL|nr:cytochrome b5 [Exidia glandulosa HHB12029]